MQEVEYLTSGVAFFFSVQGIFYLIKNGMVLNFVTI